MDFAVFSQRFAEFWQKVGELIAVREWTPWLMPLMIVVVTTVIYCVLTALLVVTHRICVKEAGVQWFGKAVMSVVTGVVQIALILISTAICYATVGNGPTAAFMALFLFTMVALYARLPQGD